MKNTGLLRSNIEYSKSPHIHHEYCKLKEFNFWFNLFNLQENQMKNFTDKLDSNNIVDFNRKLPYKEYVIDFLNQFTYPASEKGAVNTVALERT